MPDTETNEILFAQPLKEVPYYVQKERSLVNASSGLFWSVSVTAPSFCKDLVSAELKEKLALHAENCSTMSLAIPLYRQTPLVNAFTIT